MAPWAGRVKVKPAPIGRQPTKLSMKGIVPVRYPLEFTTMIKSTITANYGIHFSQRDDWLAQDLASLQQALQMIEAACQTLDLPRSAVVDLLGETILRLTTRYSLVGYILRAGHSAAMVPPMGILGWQGHTIYFAPKFSASLVIHEFGHRLDFKLGSTYRRSTLDNLKNPSTHLMHITHSHYVDNKQTCQRHKWLWGYCIATRGWNFLKSKRFNPVRGSGYQPGMSTSHYGATDHFEDFAESWMTWVLDRSGQRLNKQFDPQRLAFFDENLPHWWQRLHSTQKQAR